MRLCPGKRFGCLLACLLLCDLPRGLRVGFGLLERGGPCRVPLLVLGAACLGGLGIGVGAGLGGGDLLGFLDL